MVLDNDLRILLPPERAVAALERVIALHQAQDLLDRDLAVVDMRLGDRPTIRLNPTALASLRGDAAMPEAAAAPIEEDH
jgi:cell division protein FtsQ